MRSMEESYAVDSTTRALIRTTVAACQDLEEHYRLSGQLPPKQLEDCLATLAKEDAHLVRRWD
jgi:hypothetical protein